MRLFDSCTNVTVQTRTVSLLIALAAMPFAGPVRAQRHEFRLPEIFGNDAKGMAVALDENDLTDFEIQLGGQFARKDAPDEIFALAWARPAQILIQELGEPVGLMTISVFGKQGELRWYLGDTMERYYYRDVSPVEIERIRRFLDENKVDELPELGATRPNSDGVDTSIVGGVQYLYLRLGARRGRRILINNPPVAKDDPDIPRDDVIWRYTKVVDFFGEFTNDTNKVDGRWTVGNRQENGELVCYDRRKKRFILIADDRSRLNCYPLYFLENHRVFLLGRFDVHQVSNTKGSTDSHHRRDLRILDPLSGDVQEIGALPDVEPLQVSGASLWFQDLPRQLQPVQGHDRLVWAAIPLSKATQIGQFDTKRLRWRDYEVIPKLKFETKNVWVDEVQHKCYIVYKGHLLRIPLPQSLHFRPQN